MLRQSLHRLRRLLTVIVIAGMGNSALVSLAAAQTETREYPIKAAFLFKFGEFVAWPAGAFAAADAPLNICIVGDNAFAGTVNQAVQNETVAGRRVVARPMATIAAGDGCHIAYLSGSAQQPVAEALRILAGRPVLTVTDENVGPTPGVIHFVIRSNRVRFEIDDAVAAANGITLSSALLNIALNVKRRD